MQTSSLPFGSVCAPGQRYHPAIVAQAVSTLAEMFPGRYWIALGSGEALNERITGERWPIKSVRNARLLECFQIIKKLLSGEKVTHHGLVNVEDARLYTLPKIQPLILGAAVTADTARWMGSWADGMITVHQKLGKMKEVVDAFRSNGGKGKPVFLKVQLSFDKTEEDVVKGAHDQWRSNIFNSTVLGEMWQVEQFDALGELVTPSEMRDMVRMSADVRQHIDWIKQDMELEFDRIILHNVNREQEFFINEFGEKVLPKLQ